MRRVVVVSADDWDALYVDGCLEYEGHSIPQWELIAACVGSTEALRYSVDAAWIEEEVRYPSRLADIPSACLRLEDQFPVATGWPARRA